MPPTLSLEDLLAYSEWERDQWHVWFRTTGAEALAVTTGPHGDGRFETVGSLVKHIFSAELRYVDRLLGRPLSDPGSVPTTEVEPLFQFGRRSRAQLRGLLESLPGHQWDDPREFALGNYLVTATPRKIVSHVVLHELRHWPQVATLLRLQGLRGEVHDLLASPVLGGEFRRA